jgi:hypothetical protein
VGRGGQTSDAPGGGEDPLHEVMLRHLALHLDTTQPQHADLAQRTFEFIEVAKQSSLGLRTRAVSAAPSHMVSRSMVHQIVGAYNQATSSTIADGR